MGVGQVHFGVAAMQQVPGLQLAVPQQGGVYRGCRRCQVCFDFRCGWQAGPIFPRRSMAFQRVATVSLLGCRISRATVGQQVAQGGRLATILRHSPAAPTIPKRNALNPEVR